MTSIHTVYIQQSLKLAEDSVRQFEGGPFGAIVVQNQKIIGEGYNQVTLKHDPTAHAEVLAIRHACQALKTFELVGCILYTSCEPCPMCLSAAYWARMSHIYYCNTRAEAAQAGFMDENLYTELCLPIEQRHLPVTHLQSTVSGRAFQAWADKETRIQY